MTDLGLLYVVAASLPLLASLVTGIIATFEKRKPPEPHHTQPVDRLQQSTAWISIVALGLSAVLSIVGLIVYQQQGAKPWTASFTWLSLTHLGFEGQGKLGFSEDSPGVELHLGYHVDSLTTVLFLVITLVAICIFLSSTFLMRKDLRFDLFDNIARVHRPGRFALFFTLFSAFAGVMLHLVLAPNLLQMFICWELVGLCSYFLIGFYREQAISNLAARKAFVMNRVGDAGFLVGIVILWTYTGTLSFVTTHQQVRDVMGKPVMEDGQPKIRIDQVSLTDALRVPGRDSHDEPFVEKGAEAGMMSRVNPARSRSGKAKLELSEAGSLVVVWNQETLNGHYDKPDRRRFNAFDPHSEGGHGQGLRTIPYWVLGLAGIGLFLGCVGKSAQVPLQTWLPDAMAGPTPVSALVHSATMVAAGVYLLARVFPVFIPEVLLAISYTGLLTAFYGATCALVQTDVKRLLAYSTMSQLGFMVASLGVGGWVMALFHLATHACCKAMLFLGIGYIVDSCGYVQDISRYGGLQRKTPLLAGLMLAACLSLTGLPLLPGWYSKDGILASLLSFGSLDGQHLVLALVPFLVTGLTAAYLFRFWWLLFAGSPREASVSAAIRDITKLARWPLIALLLLAFALVWLPHPLAMDKGWVVRWLQQSEPLSTREELTIPLAGANEQLASGYFKTESWLRPLFEAIHIGPHGLALSLGLVGLILGCSISWLLVRGATQPWAVPAGCPRHWLLEGWGWDTFLLYWFVKPLKRLGQFLTWLDQMLWDGLVHAFTFLARALAHVEKHLDEDLVDGIVRHTSTVTHGAGQALRHVQTGSLRTYVLLVGLAAAVLGGIVLVVYLLM